MNGFGLKPYEVTSLVLVVIFGLAGAWLYETFADGEYLAYFICLPPPVGFYLYSIWKHEKEDIQK
jgi:hypothetical protein